MRKEKLTLSSLSSWYRRTENYMVECHDIFCLHRIVQTFQKLNCLAVALLVENKDFGSRSVKSA